MKKTDINTNTRLFDLVRYSRATLHQDGLITDDEYAWLCAAPMATSENGGSPSARRLEDYDELRAEIKMLRHPTCKHCGEKMPSVPHECPTCLRDQRDR